MFYILFLLNLFIFHSSVRFHADTFFLCPRTSLSSDEHYMNSGRVERKL